MLLNWKGAEPRCRFCKRSNHLIKDCRNLKRKLEMQYNEKLEQIAQKAKIETERSLAESDKSKINTNSEPGENQDVQQNVPIEVYIIYLSIDEKQKLIGKI